MILWYIKLMKTCGIVVEYNPFHNGHIHHISQTRQITHCDILIAVMSPNFVQRGEPAIIDKWHRTQNALEHGVDLVVELPFIFATQSAEPFAMGAMHLLNLMGCDAFCFGSESHDLQELIRLSQLEKMELDKKKAPVQSYEQMYGTLYANDILGINYLKYSKNMKPYCIKRTNHYFDEQLEENISSATSIRKAVQDQLDISKATPVKIENPVFLKDFYPMIQLLLFTLPKDSLKELFLMDEGIENLLIKNAQASSFEEFMNHSISKKYTRSRIQRTCIHLLNQTTKKQVNELSLPDSVRILGANDKGRQYLRKSDFLYASKFNQIEEAYRQMEYKATCLYSLALPEHLREDFRKRELEAPIFL